MDYNKLERKIAEMEKNKLRLQGSLDQLLQQLKQNFGCKTVDEAREKLKRMTSERNRAREEFDEMLEGFLKKNRSRLNV